MRFEANGPDSELRAADVTDFDFIRYYSVTVSLHIQRKAFLVVRDLDHWEQFLVDTGVETNSTKVVRISLARGLPDYESVPPAVALNFIIVLLKLYFNNPWVYWG